MARNIKTVEPKNLENVQWGDGTKPVNYIRDKSGATIWGEPIDFIVSYSIADLKGTPRLPLVYLVKNVLDLSTTADYDTVKEFYCNTSEPEKTSTTKLPLGSTFHIETETSGITDFDHNLSIFREDVDCAFLPYKKYVVVDTPYKLNVALSLCTRGLKLNIPTCVQSVTCTVTDSVYRPSTIGESFTYDSSATYKLYAGDTYTFHPVMVEGYVQIADYVKRISTEDVEHTFVSLGLKKYTITYDLGGRHDNITQQVEHGTVPTAPAVSNTDREVFSGWSEAFVAAKEDKTYTAIWNTDTSKPEIGAYKFVNNEATGTGFTLYYNASDNCAIASNTVEFTVFHEEYFSIDEYAAEATDTTIDGVKYGYKVSVTTAPEDGKNKYGLYSGRISIKDVNKNLSSKDIEHNYGTEIIFKNDKSFIYAYFPPGVTPVIPDKPTDLIEDVYNFEGWYLDSTFTTPVGILGEGRYIIYAKCTVKEFPLTINALPTGVASVRVERLNSPLKHAALGVVENGGTIYHSDIISVTPTAHIAYDDPTVGYTGCNSIGSNRYSVTTAPVFTFTQGAMKKFKHYLKDYNKARYNIDNVVVRRFPNVYADDYEKYKTSGEVIGNTPSSGFYGKYGDTIEYTITESTMYNIDLAYDVVSSYAKHECVKTNVFRVENATDSFTATFYPLCGLCDSGYTDDYWKIYDEGEHVKIRLNINAKNGSYKADYYGICNNGNDRSDISCVLYDFNMNRLAANTGGANIPNKGKSFALNYYMQPNTTYILDTYITTSGAFNEINLVFLAPYTVTLGTKNEGIATQTLTGGGNGIHMGSAYYPNTPSSITSGSYKAFYGDRFILSATVTNSAIYEVSTISFGTAGPCTHSAVPRYKMYTFSIDMTYKNKSTTDTAVFWYSESVYPGFQHNAFKELVTAKAQEYNPSFTLPYGTQIFVYNTTTGTASATPTIAFSGSTYGTTSGDGRLVTEMRGNVMATVQSKIYFTISHTGAYPAYLNSSYAPSYSNVGDFNRTNNISMLVTQTTRSNTNGSGYKANITSVSGVSGTPRVTSDSTYQNCTQTRMVFSFIPQSNTVSIYYVLTSLYCPTPPKPTHTSRANNNASSYSEAYGYLDISVPSSGFYSNCMQVEYTGAINGTTTANTRQTYVLRYDNVVQGQEEALTVITKGTAGGWGASDSNTLRFITVYVNPNISVNYSGIYSIVGYTARYFYMSGNVSHFYVDGNQYYKGQYVGKVSTGTNISTYAYNGYAGISGSSTTVSMSVTGVSNARTMYGSAPTGYDGSTNKWTHKADKVWGYVLDGIGASTKMYSSSPSWSTGSLYIDTPWMGTSSTSASINGHTWRMRSGPNAASIICDSGGIPACVSLTWSG